MRKPENPKERNLVKGAIRRVFSRSELRREVLAAAIMDLPKDPNRPRVTKWALCSICRKIEAAYMMEVDHIHPVVPLDKSLEELSWDILIERLWCNPMDLQVVCKECHKAKSKAENKERRLLKRDVNE